MRNIISAIVCSVIVCGCGSASAPAGPGAAAAGKSFSYDAPQAPTADEAAAAAGVQSAFSANPSDAAAAVVALLQKLSTDASGFALPAPVGNLPALSSAACVTTNGNTFTFNNCSVTEGAVTVTVNGSLTASQAGASWDVTADVQGARAAATYSIATHDVGNFTGSEGHVSGQAGSDISGTVAVNGQTVSTFALATSVALDLGYQLTPPCVTSGTLEAKLVWTQRPAGVTVADKGVKIAWTGCGAFQVSHSR
ncbi:MAG TPA: hypothetical protein VGH20_01290 [Myxococcales bacterium]|jgi:hypothetical protein